MSSEEINTKNLTVDNTQENATTQKLSIIKAIKENLRNPNTFKIRFSLMQKVLLAFVVLTMGIVLSLGTIAIESEKDVITRKVADSSFEMADVVAHEIGQVLENANRILISTSKIPAIRSFDDTTTKAIFESLLSNFKIFSRISIIDINGKEIFSTLHDSTPLSSKIWYSLILKGNYNAYYQSDIYYINDSLPTLTMAILMRDQAFKVSGVLIADLDLKSFWPIIDRIQLGQTGISYIVDQDGLCVAHSKSKNLIGKKLDSSDLVLGLIKNTKDNAELKSRLNFSEEANKRTKLYAASDLKKFTPSQNPFSSFKYPSVYVILEQDKKEAFLEAELLQKKVWYFVIVSIFISILISLILSLSLTRPIFKLVGDATRISQGDLNTAVKIYAHDEVGQLSHNFDLMRQNLAYKMWELEIINEVGQKISSVLNLEDLLKLMLNKYIETSGSDRSSIMLFDEETGTLTTNIARASSDNLELFNVDPNTGLAGHVYQTGKPVLIRDAENSEELKQLKKGAPVYPGSLMSIPLVVKDRILGVINVSKSEPEYFTNRDFQMFTALSVQSAIAIDNAILYRLAITDGMTKLYLHRYFQQRMNNEISRSLRYNYKFSLIITDIDHFKKFNDTFGHQVGDQVLKEVARLVQQSVREVDIVARYGGEEFAVICPEKSNDETIIPAERIRKAVESFDFRVEGKSVPITISLGVAEFPTDAVEKKDLIECADIALYSSKQNGRNRFTRYSDIPPNMRNIKDMKH